MDDPRTPPRPTASTVGSEREVTPTASTTVGAERTTTITEARPAVVVDPDRPVRPGASSDRVRWGPLWAGLVVTIAVFGLLQLTFFATDAISIDINPTESSNAVPIWTAIAAIVAFFLGGLVASATSKWDSLTDGLLQGVVLWALAVVALLILSVVGASIVTSSFGELAERLTFIQESLSDINAGNVDQAAAVDEARDTAASAVLLLGITIAAAVLGALAGAKMWPGRDRRYDHDDTYVPAA